MNALMPLSVLIKLAKHPELPDYLKARVIQSIWLRAVLLKEEAVASEFAPLLAQALPGLTGMENYLKAKNPETRLFEAVWLMLKNPGLKPLVEQGQGRDTAIDKIDQYRDNWWCDQEFDAKYYDTSASTQAVALRFLNETELKQAADENEKIKALTGGANFLAAQTVYWSEQQPKEARLPEALHLAVKATRFGCQNCATAKASKAAFDVLNKRYKNSDWKKQTPYWFGEKCEDGNK